MSTNEDSNQIISIGDLAKSIGLTTRTLRYWEEVGIIESEERVDGANRGYSPYYVRRIKFIMKLKNMGLTIKEMQDLYIAYGEAKETNQMIPKLVAILDKHTQLVDEKIAQLHSLRKDIVEYRQKMAAKHAAGAEK
ncbi:MAG: MerR family transcriptional regulator [Desulfuromonadaceae bacterium]|nr:MerR family transcriptional regulator [Desulfuromonadaceae bacterium]